ncbi:hypothetical protein MHY85_01935 [Cellulomonas sp. ACRRI]|uniref:hypothetical protein n=1 Tax=Cellulomonas sp. ACRRI TaxID=2918188 RepID=UPI001EF33A3C|nr:hypothetical protein [Cellulomonas sp. ACRRI]MCG7284731.1 hypothetical protein [Cellulomonas sp. ACRRI]
MSTSVPSNICVDCWKFGHRIAAKGERCDAHRAAYRRWYQATWKAKKAGRASGASNYVAEQVRVDRVYVAPEVLEAMVRLNGELDTATRMLLLLDTSQLDPTSKRRVLEARTKVATSSKELEDLVEKLSGARRLTLAVREKGARRPAVRAAQHEGEQRVPGSGS